MSAPPPPRQPTLALVGALGALAAVTLRLAGLPWLDVAALVAFLVLLPVLSVIQVRLVAEVEVERLPAYVSSMVSLLVLGGVALGVGARADGLAAVGLVPLPWPAFLSWTAVLTVGGLAVTAAFRVAGAALGLTEAPLLRALLPRSPRERGVFAGLSLAAGVGEELAYRGYVIPVLAAVTGVPAAAVVSTVVFGVLHVYQGALGMARTTALGGLLAWAFLASGSLLPAMAAHAVLDILLGILLAERMMVPQEPGGVSGEGHG